MRHMIYSAQYIFKINYTSQKTKTDGVHVWDCS